MALSVKRVSIPKELELFSSDLVKNGGVYESTRDPSLLVHLPSTTLVEGLDGDFTSLSLDATTFDFFTQFEADLVRLAVERKSAWFRDDLDEDIIREAHKSFIDSETKTLRVRVSEDLASFDAHKSPIDAPEKGTPVKAVVELGRIIFSKTQFGVVWNLKQVKLHEECLEEEEEETPLENSILAVVDGVDDEILS